MNEANTREQSDQGREQVSEHPDEQPLVLRMTTAEAAKACGISRPTMARRIKEGQFPGATQDAKGAWHIPVPDLLAAGLNPGRQTVTPNEQANEQGKQGREQVSEHPDEQSEQVVTLPVSEWQAFTERLSVAERDRDVAIARLEERAQVVDALRMTVRAIEMREPTTDSTVEDLTAGQPQTVVEPLPKPRRWWRKH